MVGYLGRAVFLWWSTTGDGRGMAGHGNDRVLSGAQLAGSVCSKMEKRRDKTPLARRGELSTEFIFAHLGTPARRSGVSQHTRTQEVFNVGNFLLFQLIHVYWYAQWQ